MRDDVEKKVTLSEPFYQEQRRIALSIHPNAFSLIKERAIGIITTVKRGTVFIYFFLS